MRALCRVQALLDPFTADESTTPFAAELQKLQAALQKSSDGEHRFAKKCMELVKVIRQTDARMLAIMQTSDEADAMKQQLQQVRV